MGGIKKYIISFGSLPFGEHIFSFDLDDGFFSGSGASGIESANIKTEIRLIKKNHLLELIFNLQGTVLAACDRCLEQVSLPVKYHATLFVKPEGEESDDVIIIPPAENELDVARYLYEFSILSLPYRRVHPENNNGESACNPAMIEKLNELSVHESPGPDNTIWKNLKNLIN